MANTARNIAMGILAAGTVMAAPHPATAANLAGAPAVEATIAGHVRPADARISETLHRAVDASPTLRDLLDTIEASDSLVYLSDAPCSHNQHACFVNTKTAGQFRLLFVNIDLRRARDEAELDGSIGHELRHATEVIGDPTVRSTALQFFLYERIGFRGNGGAFETQAAIQTGLQIRDEVAHFMKAHRR